jgi:polyhydroxybutyrate depolymerase
VYDPVMGKALKVLLAVIGFVVGLPIVWTLAMTAVVGLVDETNGTIVSSGEEREYLLHVPKGHDRKNPVPLVISLHGAMNWPAFQKNLTRWNQVADENGFIVVYPAGMGSGPKTWFMHDADTPSQMPDVKFMSELIDKLKAEYNIDPARVYADGMSNGGGMAFALSCTLSHRIAAIGAVAAAQSLPWSWCTDSRPVPMMAFHGTADPVVPYAGGKVWIAPKPFPAVPAWTANWGRRNRCTGTPVETAAAAGVTRLEYRDCADGAAVVLFTTQGGGHTWPGGKPLPEWIVGPNTNSVDATRTLWAFFREHPLRTKQ